MKISVRSLLVYFAAVLLVTAQAEAGAITINGDELVSPDHFLDFDAGAVGQVTTQFAASGLNFVTLSGAGITLVDNAACTNTGVGVSGRYLYMGVSPGPSGSCFTNATSDAVSIQFANDVSELSWRGFIISPNFTIQALNNGIVVSQTVFNTQVYISGGTPVLFSGSVFDEIRFIENGSAGQYFAVDNMRWTDAAAAPVPEPTSLLLLGTGVFGLMAKARRRRKDPTV